MMSTERVESSSHQTEMFVADSLSADQLRHRQDHWRHDVGGR